MVATYYKALEVWTAQTLCNIGILLSVVSFILHLGRPYFERILGRLTLRVAADLWWLVYIVLRDGSLLLAVLLGFLHLNLDLMADIKIGLPFVPAGTVVLAAAITVKVFRNTEDGGAPYHLTYSLVTLGAALNVIGYVLVMEAPGDEYAASKTAVWGLLHSWRSNLNPDLASFTFYTTFTALVLLAAVAVVLAARLKRGAGKEPSNHVRA